MYQSHMQGHKSQRPDSPSQQAGDTVDNRQTTDNNDKDDDGAMTAEGKGRVDLRRSLQ